ncbi:SIMPL domain-containing protein [Thalassotalea nanhaiensis]|uniref:SIMPL domain-containing protein n=1 Tax=Thalassotalea nanhaiensis TaxID=3065648 RepID=A0ABY9TKI5_9GAMM|nr:SIMPL domain-containing protein [Colwelliaceae bacterium SQ345]
MYKIACILFFSIISLSAYSANLPDFPFVVSVGEAERDVKPDKATLQLSLMAFDKESDDALQNINKTSVKIFELVKKYKLDEKSLEATDINKSTKRKRDEDYNRLEVLGYEVSRSINIKLKDLTKYSELMGELVALNNVSNVTAIFDVSNRKSIEAELMNEASKNANLKANQLAESLNTQIHSVYAISQVSNFGNFFATFGTDSQRYAAMEQMSVSGSRVAMFAPEKIKISQGVNVVFRIK